MSEMKEKLHTGELYLPGDASIMEEQMVYQDRLCEYNLTKPSETEKRASMLKEMLGDCGEGVYIEAPFYANFGGHHCHFMLIIILPVWMILIFILAIIR